MLPIPPSSKVYRKEDFFAFRNQQAHANGLPAVQTKLRSVKQSDTPVNTALRNIIKERMIGSLINYEMLLKNVGVRRHNRADSLGQINKTVVVSTKNNRCQNHQRQRSIPAERNHFISAIDMSKQGSIVEGRQKSLGLSLPPIANPTVDRSIWKTISLQNRLKRDLFVKLLARCFGEYICNQLIRFFEPPFEGVLFKYTHFVESIVKCPTQIQRLFMFQVMDFDADGVISCEDLFKMHQLIGEAEYRRSLQLQIYRLQERIDDSGATIGTFKGQTLFQYLSLNHNLTLRDVQGVIDQQHKPFLQSSIKKFTGYQHTFLVTEHNQEIRMQKQRAQDIKSNLQKEIQRKKKGLTYSVYAQTPQPIMQHIIRVISSNDSFQF